jgi:hypothetical protein
MRHVVAACGDPQVFHRRNANMPKDLIERTASPTALDDLARRIDAEHEAALRSARTAIEHAIECGQLLLEARASVPHGGWLPWLRENTKVSERTAQRWMRFAENAEALLVKSATVADLTFADADRLLDASKPAPPSAWQKLQQAIDEFIDGMLELDPDTSLEEAIELLRECASMWRAGSAAD